MELPNKEELQKLFESGVLSEKEEIELLKLLEAERKNEALQDTETFAEEYIKIIDKKGNQVPLKSNNIQREISQRKRELRAHGKLVRVIVIKPRQCGVSTHTQGEMLSNTATKGNRTGLIVAHTQNATGIIFEKARYMYNNLPDHVKPLLKASNAKELVFDRPTGYKGKQKGLNSKISVQTAGDIGIGRGDTIHYFHGCLHKDSLVLLADGNSKKIGEIAPGDLIITSGGEIAPVKHKFYTGIKDTYKIKTWLSNEYIATTAEHKILTDSGYKQCKDLTKYDYVCLPNMHLTNEIEEYVYFPYHATTLFWKPINKYVYRIYSGVMDEQSAGYDTEREAHLRSQERIEYLRENCSSKIKMDYDFGYFLGYYLAEGHVTKNKRRIGFTYHIKETYVNNVLKFLGNTISEPMVTTKGNRKVTEINSKYWATLACEICGRTEGKHIPEWFFKTNDNFVKGLLAGYFSGDGSKTHELANGKYEIHRIRAISIHEKISRQIKRLVLAFNVGVPSLDYLTNRMRYGKQTKNVYNLSCHGNAGDFIERLIGNEHLCNTRPNTNKYKKINNNWYVKIKSVDFFEKADVYDIEVDHLDHNYETPIGIVSNSETAFWPAPDGKGVKKQLAGIMAAMPKTLETEAILESTANGYNEFKELCDDAKDGKNEWTLLFFAWHDFELNIMDCTDEEYQRLVDSLDKKIYEYLFGTPKQQGIVKLYNLTKEQIKWWVWTYRNDNNGDFNMMKQENPSSYDEAFISTGTPVFDNEKVNARIAYLRQQYERNPPRRGRFAFEWNNPEAKDYIKDNTIKWVDDPNGFVMIYENAQPGTPYVIGGDTKGEGRDFYAGAVINNVTGNRTAAIRNCWTNSKPYTWQMYCLGHYYNLALIGIEMNFNTAPIEELERLHYSRQYTRRQYDSETKEYMKKHGWKTDGNTRPLIIDKEIHLIEDNIDLFNDIPMLEECLTFIYDKNGRPDAMSGKHDDALISDMIANEIRQQQSFEAEARREDVPRNFDDDTEHYDRSEDESPWN